MLTLNTILISMAKMLIANLGYLKYKDVNGDGKITADDRTFIGSPHPPTLSYGTTLDLQYKNWNVVMFLPGVFMEMI